MWPLRYQKYSTCSWSGIAKNNIHEKNISEKWDGISAYYTLDEKSITRKLNCWKSTNLGLNFIHYPHFIRANIFKSTNTKKLPAKILTGFQNSFWSRIWILSWGKLLFLNMLHFSYGYSFFPFFMYFKTRTLGSIFLILLLIFAFVLISWYTQCNYFIFLHFIYSQVRKKLQLIQWKTRVKFGEQERYLCSHHFNKKINVLWILILLKYKIFTIIEHCHKNNLN